MLRLKRTECYLKNLEKRTLFIIEINTSETLKKQTSRLTMNCQNRILLLLLLCAVHAVTAFQSTSESVNPFNEYYSANASVNEYTGTAAASLPLGKVGSADIMLKYSSNVTTNARANNKIAPTGSVGLGWQLGFGSVVCDHKNTYTIDDDDYFFINSNGATKKILTAQKLNYKYYDLSSYSWSALPELSTFTATDSGTTENFTLNLHDQITNFGYIFSGEIYVPADGSYTFGVRCDDGVRLYIDGTSVFETSLYAVQSVTANPIVKTLNGLTKGYHTIKVEYFQRTSTYSLELYFYPADGTSQRLTTSVLSHPGSAGEGRRLYFLEDDPYVKIERVEDQGICTGWIFTEPNGKKYRYGSLSFTNTRLATRNIFANSATGYVGNVISGTPTAYPYQWDLSQIEETDGEVQGLLLLAGQVVLRDRIQGEGLTIEVLAGLEPLVTGDIHLPKETSVVRIPHPLL